MESRPTPLAEEWLKRGLSTLELSAEMRQSLLRFGAEMIALSTEPGVCVDVTPPVELDHLCAADRVTVLQFVATTVRSACGDQFGAAIIAHYRALSLLQDSARSDL